MGICHSKEYIYIYIDLLDDIDTTELKLIELIPNINKRKQHIRKININKIYQKECKKNKMV